ncbi:hypothetical protein AB0L65_22700 [Nonomuraea sp. NPDC052116]|uniref:hypothetical protein n=1 Tax=Nonomuraea sp. NPDC052116 TaxID=3155665 RepID=UPI003419D882
MKTERDLPGYICRARIRQGVKCKSVFAQRALVTVAVLDILAEWAHDIETAAEGTDGARPSPGPRGWNAS